MDVSKPGNRSFQEAGHPPREATSLESRAERLLAEYLRVWGLRDPQTIAKLSRHWVQSAGVEGSATASGSLTDLYRTVMRQAIGDMGQWLDHLSGEIASNARDARSCRGLLAIELQNVIDHFPAALLDERSLPETLRQQLVSASLNVVPACCPTRMPTQSLEAVSSSKYLSRWNRLWTGIWCRLLRTFSYVRES